MRTASKSPLLPFKQRSAPLSRELRIAVIEIGSD